VIPARRSRDQLLRQFGESTGLTAGFLQFDYQLLHVAAASAAPAGEGKGEYQQRNGQHGCAGSKELH